MDRIASIRERINHQLKPVQLDIVDESHLHADHAGHGGAGHFAVSITADIFNGKSLIECHRLVYAAVDDLMRTEIHALSIKATPTQER